MLLARTGIFELRLLMLLACQATSGCRGCDRGEVRRQRPERSQQAEPTESAGSTESPGSTEPAGCRVPTDCADGDACIKEACVGGRCVASLEDAGTSCDNETVCDGVSTCDQTGHCVPGTAPLLDDSNACTLDSCDPTRGVTHQPVPIDDSDACTSDVCEPETGEIAHSPVDLDDGDDCTNDSCDRRAGIRHEARSPVYTCNSHCEAGFHVSSRIPAQECGASRGLRSVCMPDCGAHFYTCDSNCPHGYRALSKSANNQCGTAVSAYTFCQKERSAPSAGAPSR